MIVLAFYNNKAILLELDKENLYLFQDIKNEISMNHFNYKSNISKKDNICSDCNGEFDITLIEDSIYLVYQDLLRNLNLSIIKENKITNIPMTDEPMDRIYELNIFNSKGLLNMVYLKALLTEEKTYRIIHNYIEDNEWKSNSVTDVKIDQAINPMKIIKKDENFILCFYNGNVICIKELNSEDSKWDETIVLTKSKNKRLYLDILLIENTIHLVYSQYQNHNYVIVYERHNYIDGTIIKESQQLISNESNCSNPTLILYEDNIWVVWNESSRLYSSLSLDGGKTWSPIYYWKEIISKELLRYKYIKSTNSENTKLDYSFGTIRPEIMFVGFGPLKNVDEVKKNEIINIGENQTLEDVKSHSLKNTNDSHRLIEKISLLESDLKDSASKLELIEDFLIKNTQGHYERAKKDKSD